MRLLEYSVCFLLIAAWPVPIVLLHDLVRYTLFRRLAREYDLIPSKKLRPFWTLLQSNELVSLRRFEGTIKGRHVVVEDIYVNRYFDRDPEAIPQDKS